MFNVVATSIDDITSTASTTVTIVIVANTSPDYVITTPALVTGKVYRVADARTTVTVPLYSA